jgi:hypothetical protein
MRRLKLARILPTKELIMEACKESEGDIADQALQLLFDQYRQNNQRAQVLLKVVTLNRLYSAGILAVYDVAEHIHQRAAEIDAALDRGSPEIVDTIAKVTIRSRVGALNFYSFASKYCSWHNQLEYPIWDSRVCRYLSSLEGTPFAHPDRWTHYAEFKDLMCDFRSHYKLGDFTFKQIDMFLWKHGAPLDASEPGAQI